MYLNRKLLPVLVTFGLLAVMIAIGSFRYTGFFSTQVLFNLLIDNAFLIITAIGMTFVIVSGGIDLSVGSVIALTTIISASLVEKQGWSPAVVIPMVLVMGALFGTMMGAIIHYFKIQPFIVTLAGMFLARGLCYVISTDTITITNSFYTTVAQAKFHSREEALYPSTCCLPSLCCCSPFSLRTIPVLDVMCTRLAEVSNHPC